MQRYRVGLVCLALLVAGLALRLPGLGGFLTPDEGDWTNNTAKFLLALSRSDWAATLTATHPGVTTTWAGSVGLALKWLFARPADANSFIEMVRPLAAGPVHLEFLPWMRLPVVVTGALATIAIYLLARRLFDERTALLGAGLFALDPFFLAHSRVLHTDALQATFLTLTWLALLVGRSAARRRWYAAAGVAFALAVLTKSPSLVLGPLVVAWIVAAILLEWRSQPADASAETGSLFGKAHGPSTGSGTVRLTAQAVCDVTRSRAWVRRGLADLLWFGLPALCALWLLWPALWVAPAHTVGQVLGLMLTYGGVPHELGSFWLGSPVEVPGRAYYLAVLLWRSTPVTLIGGLLALAAFGTVARTWLARRSRGRAKGAEAPARRASANMNNALALGLFMLWFTLFQSLGSKTADRYLLPVFPALDLLAAWGWIGAVRAFAAGGSFAIAVALLIAGQAIVLPAARPNYMDVYNPLVGGMATARQVMLVGWGEGLAEAAAYLNEVDPEGERRVAAWYGQNVFGPFYRGRSFDLYYDARTAADLYKNDVDYVVTYVGQEQRRLLDPTVGGLLGEALYIVKSGQAPLAKIYRWPKPFEHTTDQLLGPGLRLVGWDLSQPAASPGAASLTLYWDEAELATLPPSSVPLAAWLKDANGEIWSRVDTPGGWGASSADVAAAAGWLGRPTLAQTLSLPLPAGLRAGMYRVEMAVAGARGESLGGFTLPPSRLAGAPSAAAMASGPADRPLDPAPVFDGRIGLTGYRGWREGNGLVLELIWGFIAGVPNGGLQGAPGTQYFVHLTDASGRIVSQADGPLDQGQAGEVVRLRVRLTLPAPFDPAAYRVYVGLYKPAGARLPLSLGGEPGEADGRYLLTDALH